MAKLPPKKESGDSQEWLNTYADMVTLLLTFFVLLFACSNLDETKMQFILQAFQMRGKYVNPVVAEPADPSLEQNGGITDDATDVGSDGSMPQSYDELYQYLAEFIDSNNLGDNVSIENSASYFTLRFNSSVFFDGDSHLLKPDGKELLAKFAPLISVLEPHIKTLTCTGHTSVGSSAISDWTLSAMRAASVANFLCYGDYTGNYANMKLPVINPDKIRVRGCGNTEPLYENAEDLHRNRRVELVMLKDNLDMTDSKVVQDIIRHDLGLDADPFDINEPTPGKDYTALPDGSAEKIVGFIESTFKGDGYTHVGTMGPSAVDGSMFLAPASDESGADKGGETE